MRARPIAAMNRTLVDAVLGTAFCALTWPVLFATRAAPHAATPAAAASLSAHDAPSEPEKIASYTILARLDAEQHRVQGSEVIRFQNASSQPLTELWFHLYLNAFKNDKTLFLRSPFGAGRSGEKAHEYGYVDVKHLRLASGEELWPNADRHSPGDPDDETDIRVPLPTPLAPGARLELSLEFEDKLPEIVERTGYEGSFHMLGQWFPKLAKLEPDGHFAHFSFHPHSEFYADFGDYDVTLDVPTRMTVGATGVAGATRSEAGRTTIAYRAEGVHDFAWTAWDHFAEARSVVAGVDVRVLYPSGEERSAELELDAVRFALPHFNELYGAYPYKTLTLVHPPDAAGNAGGMEYPTLITTGGPWYTALTGTRLLEDVTIHELGHQWFYGLVATNEHEFPFLDEGLNSYAEAEALEARFGSGSSFEAFGLSVSSSTIARLFSATRGGDQAVSSPAAEITSFRNLGALVYERTATTLLTVARVYGEAQMRHALGSYTRRFRFQHPTPRDFLNVMRRELGADAEKALASALLERGTVDYVARDLSSVAAEPAAGIFDAPNGRETRKRGPAPEPKKYQGRVVVCRHGALEFPVEIELLAEDGTRRRAGWDGRGACHAVDYAGSSPLVAALVDPDHRVLLDDDLSNNFVSTRSPQTSRLWERALYGAELLVSGAAP